MNQDQISWAVVDREDLLDVLFGEYLPRSVGYRDFPALEMKSTRLAVGFKHSTSVSGGYMPPSLIVIPDESASESLSWLRTFAEESFPLSQYCRVIFTSEWHLFKSRVETFALTSQRSDRWASIAVGEALSQIEGEASVQHLPLSRFSGCFTTPIARTHLIWGQEKAVRICADRLRMLESDRRFSRRTVGVEQLLPIWSIAAARIDAHFSPQEAATLVLQAATKYFSNEILRGRSAIPSIESEEFSGLFSDSVEERVGAFNRLTSGIVASFNDDTTRSAMTSVVFAAAAFLVGRGTSHIFLLQRVQRLAPTAPAWFGVMAALAGPRAWDRAWLTAAKGAEKLLRAEFNWIDVSPADVYWSEFSWLASAFDGVDAFLDLPKMLPRTLNVEIVPGATCQFRLGGELVETESRVANHDDPSLRELLLLDAVGQFIKLAQRIEGEVDVSFSSGGGSSQRSFGFDGVSNTPKSPRAKSSKKNVSRG